MLNQNDDNNDIKKMVMLCIAAASCVLLVFLVFLYSNEKNKEIKLRQEMAAQKSEAEADEEELEIGKNNLVSEDLDFWDMYDEGYKAKPVEDYDDEEEEEDKISVKDIAERMKSSSSERKTSRDDASDEKINDKSMNNDSSSDEDDKMNDGKHIKVETEAGSVAWHEIDESLPSNDYDFKKNLKLIEGELKYTKNNEEAKIGIDISKKSGTIDFAKVKKAGIDFVMLKVGSRGYSKGEIVLDDKFVEYATGCKDAGLPLGAYFYSMAATDVEAVEEANYAVAACMNYGISYPIAIELDVVKNDSYRTKKLSNKERTLIVKTFCDTVKNYGFTPIICSDKNYLLTKLNLSELKDYDYWLKDEAITDEITMGNTEDSSSSSSSSSSRTGKVTTKSANSAETTSNVYGTDYPYKFTMWQYSTNGNINGIEGSVDLNMSFLNYEDR